MKGVWETEVGAAVVVVVELAVVFWRFLSSRNWAETAAKPRAAITIVLNMVYLIVIFENVL